VFGQVLLDLEVWRQTLVWVKDVFVLGRSDYHYRHEPIFYGWKQGAAHYFVDDRTQDTIWEIPRPRRSTEHPTMKPVALVERAIRNSSKAGEIVLEPFGGSGTTLLATEATKRRCRCIELDPRYCDVIVNRWEAFSGKRAELLTAEKQPE
jgi:site-specific DNA-methyltransferase (adenine-specific)